MEAFCTETVANIKKAKDEADLIQVISGSMSRLRKERNSFKEGAYLMNMIVYLGATKTSDLPTEVAENIRLATAIFRKLQIESREPVF